MTIDLAWRNAVALTDASWHDTYFFENVGFTAPGLPACLLARFQIDYRPSPLIATGDVFKRLVAADPVPKNMLNALLQHIECACKSGALRSELIPRDDVCSGHAEWTVRAPDFAAWLAAQNMEPSPHIAAWFKATGVATAVTPAPAPPSPAQETKEQRQDRRLQACIDAGLPMDEPAALLRLPDGVGLLADKDGVKRQTFSADVKAALERRKAAQRDGGTVHRA